MSRKATETGTARGRSMRWTRRQVLLGAAVAAAGLVAAGAVAATSFAVSRLTIESARGRFVFTVEVANTWAQRMQGLQYRRALAPGTGMLFDFRAPQPVSMWMKNTYVSLDMIFIDEAGIVFSIAERTKPLSLAPISSGGDVLAVLEVPAGTADSLGLRPGDRVHHPMFQAEPR